jgi:hypothetical protein
VATKDYAGTLAPALRPLLAEGERMLAAAPLVKDPGSTEDVSVGDELKNLLDPTILLGLGTHPGNLLQRAVFGRAVTGSRDSIARALFAAVDSAASPKVVVTDRRLLIVDVDAVPRSRGAWQRWFGPFDLVAREVYAVPRESVIGAVPAPAGLLRRGRFLVGFVDGSGCVLICAPPSLAEPVIAAIGGPHPDGAARGEEHE